MADGVRVRFAPSPTGYLHIGGARTALYNWLFARSNNGKFILRIEDSDIDRSLIDSEGKILEDMKWFGLDWDEGPDTVGDFGPYRQTERLEIYREYANKLLNEGKAYLCYCTPQELEEKRKKALASKQTPRYDGRCWNLTKEEKKIFIAEGRKPAVRFGGGLSSREFTALVVDDLIKGQVEFKEESIGDFIILKSDGTPSYNFAVVVDDALMKISHVIRGDEHLINTPRQIMLYKALGFKVPAFAHIPMILAPDHTKLSKRHGTTSVGEFREHGYLPEALINYLALLGWSPKDDREFFSLNELVGIFSLDGVAKNPAVYDIQKLKWMNRFYIKKLNMDKLTELTIPYLQKAGLVSEIDKEKFNWIKKLNETLYEKYDCLEDVIEVSRDLFADEIIYSEEIKNFLRGEGPRKIIAVFKKYIEAAGEISDGNFKDIMQKVSKEAGVKGKDLYMPVRAALTGKFHGAELPKIAGLLGRGKISKFLEETRKILSVNRI